MTVKNRNMLFTNQDAIIWEGEHALLYRAGMDNFGKPMYNIASLADATWTKEPTLYWKNFTTGHGPWGGIDGLIEMAKSLNEEVKLVRENVGNIEDVVRLVKAGKVRWQVAYDITGYYISEKEGFYCGPNKHTGYVK